MHIVFRSNTKSVKKITQLLMYVLAPNIVSYLSYMIMVWLLKEASMTSIRLKTTEYSAIIIEK